MPRGKLYYIMIIHVEHGSDSVPCDSWSSPAGSLQTLWDWTVERKVQPWRQDGQRERDIVYGEEEYKTQTKLKIGLKMLLHADSCCKHKVLLQTGMAKKEPRKNQNPMRDTSRRQIHVRKPNKTKQSKASDLGKTQWTVEILFKTSGTKTHYLRENKTCKKEVWAS